MYIHYMSFKTDYNEKDINNNRDEIIDAFYGMLDFSSNYHLYPIYKDSFQRFAFDVIDAKNLSNINNEIIPEPKFIEEDRTLVLTKKTKTKTIIEMFQQIQKI
jgi:hypothetical protein